MSNYQLYRMAALAVKFPFEVDDFEWERIREKFWKEFPVGHIEMPAERTVVAIVPEGRWDDLYDHFSDTFEKEGLYLHAVSGSERRVLKR